MTDGDAKPLSKPKPRRPGRAVTIEDVARVAGVSKGTVSRVLNGHDWVSPKTRQAVVEAMASTGFVASASARSLATSRTGNIAFVLGAPPVRLFEDPNYAVLLQVITEELAELDYALMLLTASTQAERARVARFVREGHVDGVILVLVGDAGTEELISLLRGNRMPAIACGHPFVGEDPLPFVAADDTPGVRQLARHFLARGYRSTAVIASHLETSGAKSRVAAFAGEAPGLVRDDLVIEAHEYSRAAGKNAMRTLLAARPGIDSVFAASDLLAAGAMDALHKADIAVPGQIAVAGFDDSTIAQQTDPQLTTVRQSVADVARQMVAQLRIGLDGGAMASVSVPTQLVIRESA
ncbi:LacI family DNA-binding transcriptional regulator [Streptomyces sp. FXJ1.4098]|uniref:LacI family DNA-binding transcriptional regulator n=1 Tax=Streptomyces sp. NPDC020845 TaxID=3365096 RepID=UPI0029912571|nr:LacI family DNA-binding transcriptional regulator [Streptomyces sp. FXJ1.4098]